MILLSVEELDKVYADVKVLNYSDIPRTEEEHAALDKAVREARERLKPYRAILHESESGRTGLMAHCLFVQGDGVFYKWELPCQF